VTIFEGERFRCFTNLVQNTQFTDRNWLIEVKKDHRDPQGRAKTGPHGLLTKLGSFPHIPVQFAKINPAAIFEYRQNRPGMSF
jgi:hypothetical protein|tara:strand:- start:235 stop:483 length:249 start_codon:yes stop_codon:yes gene_type:complete